MNKFKELNIFLSMKIFLKKHLIIFILVLIMGGVSIFYGSIKNVWVSKSNGITIVLDAGHGGRDGGSVGVNGTIEKEINLTYTLALKEKLSESGYKVVLTRSSDNGLYSELATNKKVSDMNARMKVIKQANPNLVISIHMNSFFDSSIKGAMCYYKVDDQASKQCGDLIQQSLKEYCNAKLSRAKEGDYFMLNCSYYTSVLIECGFLSNAEEEAMLKTEAYKNKFVEAVSNGLLLYFGNY